MDNIFNLRRTKENTVKSEKDTVWDVVFKTDAKAFRSRNNMSFNGMIRTDEVSISVCCLRLNSQRDENNNIPSVKKRKKPERTEYFQDNLDDLSRNIVFIDPKKRDLPYYLGSNGKKLRYTQMQRRKESGLKSNRIIPEKVSSQIVDQTEENTTIIIGDWFKNKHITSNSNKRKGSMFKKAGFDVFLCNDYLTSSICPVCKGRSLKTFKYRISSRPLIKRFEKVHGLLHCKIEICQLPNGKERL
ncbi:hypothetical protein HDU92_002143 [Lobulomyces angularis]|nr:hypothetical protein HDU92_002143 [Lobulomyces angularis]